MAERSWHLPYARDRRRFNKGGGIDRKRYDFHRGSCIVPSRCSIISRAASNPDCQKASDVMSTPTLFRIVFGGSVPPVARRSRCFGVDAATTNRWRRPALWGYRKIKNVHCLGTFPPFCVLSTMIPIRPIRTADFRSGGSGFPSTRTPCGTNRTGSCSAFF